VNVGGRAAVERVVRTLRCWSTMSRSLSPSSRRLGRATVAEALENEMYVSLNKSL